MKFFTVESARVLLELVVHVEPLVQDPLGALEHRAAGVRRPLIPETFLVQADPEGGRTLGGEYGDLVPRVKEGGRAAGPAVGKPGHEGAQHVATGQQVLQAEKRRKKICTQNIPSFNAFKFFFYLS